MLSGAPLAGRRRGPLWRSTLPDAGARGSVEPGVPQVSLNWERAPESVPFQPEPPRPEPAPNRGAAAASGKPRYLSAVGACVPAPSSRRRRSALGRPGRGAQQPQRGAAGEPERRGAAAGSAVRSPPPPGGFKKIHQWHSRAPQKAPAATWPWYEKE